MNSLKTYLSTINLFPSSTDIADEVIVNHERRSNVIATRIFLTTLVLVLIILILVYGISIRTTIVTIQHPTKNQFEQLPVNVHCSCSRISIPYREFISIETIFHQVCTSDFVSDRWFQAINSGYNTTYFFIFDFRIYGSASFQVLANLCRLSKANTLESITSFLHISFLTREVLSESIFQLKLSAAIKQFQLTAPNEFLTRLQLSRELIVNNHLQSGLQTNMFQYYYVSNIREFDVYFANLKYSLTNGTACFCSINVGCTFPSYILNQFGQPTMAYANDLAILMKIPGFKSGCLPTDVILLSTLECFYNQICLNKLLSFFSTKEKFTSMTIMKQTRFHQNSTVKTIVDYLMIEEWITNISYDQYYSQCAPISCTYSKNEKNDWIFILTKVISLLGGLVLILAFIIQYIVKWLRRIPETESITLLKRINILMKKIWIQLKRLNIFKRHENTEQQLYYQRIATQIYVLVLFIAIIITIFYTSLTQDIHRETIYQPSEFQYEELQQKYSTNLYCSCSSISILYSTFITINIRYHQVCSSDLVSDQWISYNKDSNTQPIVYIVYDYRYASPAQFHLLAMLCNQAHKTVDNSLELFLQTLFLSSQVIPRELFQSRINSSIYHWYTQTFNKFLQTIKIFRAISHGNQFINGASNGLIYPTNNSSRNIKIGIKQYSNCSCALSSTCVTSLNIYEVDQNTFTIINIHFFVPNFFIGCFPFDALLKSTLECFYDRLCMLELDQYMNAPLGLSFNFSSLDKNFNSPNQTIESIVNQLMIDSWSSNISFSSYYKICAPQLCTYEYITRNNIFSIITTILGVFGGLTTGLKIFILIILRCTEKIISFHSFFKIIKAIFIFNTKQQMINRLHFIFLSLILYSIFIFSAFTSKSITIQITKPSLSIYQQLSIIYSNSLQCSCSQISISHKSFLKILPYFHHLCSSQFISDQWISYLYGKGDYNFLYLSTDYRSSAPGQFLLLKSFCQLSQQTINNTLTELLISDFISSQLLSPKLLNEQIQLIINQFQLNTPNSFLNILNLIREITASNMLMSGWSTNWIYITENIIHDGWTAHTAPVVYDGCDCGSSWKCTQSSRGMMSGCYALESLLQTTLQCFYDQNCIDSSGIFPKLDIKLLKMSRYKSNNTIESILNNLMIEEYLINSSYDKYYNECSPSLCSYTYVKNHDKIEAALSLISLYSGLVVITRCLAVIIINIMYRTTRRINLQTTGQIIHNLS